MPAVAAEDLIASSYEITGSVETNCNKSYHIARKK